MPVSDLFEDDCKTANPEDKRPTLLACLVHGTDPGWCSHHFRRVINFSLPAGTPQNT